MVLYPVVSTKSNDVVLLVATRPGSHDESNGRAAFIGGNSTSRWYEPAALHRHDCMPPRRCSYPAATFASLNIPAGIGRRSRQTKLIGRSPLCDT